MRSSCVRELVYFLLLILECMQFVWLCCFHWSGTPKRSIEVIRQKCRFCIRLINISWFSFWIQSNLSESLSRVCCPVRQRGFVLGETCTGETSWFLSLRLLDTADCGEDNNHWLWVKLIMLPNEIGMLYAVIRGSCICIIFALRTTCNNL